MDKKMNGEEAVLFHNRVEFGEFIKGMTLDEFIQWVYRLYNVPADEQACIEEDYAEWEQKRS